MKPSSNKASRRAALAAAFASLLATGTLASRAQDAAAPGAAAPASAPAGLQTYRLDPAHTFATFEVRHFGTSTLRGRVGPITGEVQIDRAAHKGDVRLRIPMATLDTGFKPLDARLKQPDLLATAENPEAYFVASNFRFDVAGAVTQVRGEFTLRGVGQPLSLRARSFACRQDAMLRREVCGGDFEGELKRSDFGAGFGTPFVADAVHLVVQVEAIAG